MSNYSDPDEETLKIILDELATLKTHKEIRVFIDKVLPYWLINSLDGYSDDYPHLTSNWKIICQKVDIVPQKIIIVDYINFDKDHMLLNILCERMTREGYVVRRKDEFTKCESCNKAIPSIEIYKIFKENNIQAPEEWSSKCKNCF